MTASREAIRLEPKAAAGSGGQEQINAAGQSTREEIATGECSRPSAQATAPAAPDADPQEVLNSRMVHSLPKGEPTTAESVPLTEEQQIEQFFSVSSSHLWIRDLALHGLRESRDANALQAKIDHLMLEYCPEEMTPEQIENWRKHQHPATKEETSAIDAARRLK